MASLANHHHLFPKLHNLNPHVQLHIHLSPPHLGGAPLLWLRPAALPGGHRRQREPASSRPGTACTRQRAPLARSVRARLRVGSAQERAAAGRRRSRAASVADRPDSCSRVARTRLSAGGGVGVRVRSVFSVYRGVGTIFLQRAPPAVTVAHWRAHTIMHSSRPVQLDTRPAPTPSDQQNICAGSRRLELLLLRQSARKSSERKSSFPPLRDA